MRTLKMLVVVVSLLLTSACATKTNIKGEQIDFPPPVESKLAFFTINKQGEYLIEYTDAKEKVESWKDYLVSSTSFSRSKFDLAILLKLGLGTLMKSCPTIRISNLEEFTGKHFNGRALAFAYYCPKPSLNAPYGEASLMVFLEGKEKIFQHWHSWRLQQKPKAEDLFGISRAKLLIDYSFMQGQLGLCNPEKQDVCRFDKYDPKRNKWNSFAVELSERELKRFTGTLTK